MSKPIPHILTYFLSLFDLYMTSLWVKRYGMEVEANPIGRFLLQTNLAIPVKILGIGAALTALYAGTKRYPRWKWTGWLVLAVYSGLGVYHIIIAFIT